VTSQEEQLLNSLVERVNQTQLQEKDPDAEALLKQGLGSNADALYIMAQTVLVQNIALEQAKAQVGQLQQQLAEAQTRPPARATSFLGNLLGHHDPPQPQYLPPRQQGYVPPPPPPPGYDPQYAQAGYGPGGYGPGGYGPGGYGPAGYVQSGPPSFLRGAMQTAAGVAAGALAFEGVESILHGMGGFGHGGYGFGGPGMGMMGGGFERPIEENVVNNYYDQPAGSEHEHGGLEHSGLQNSNDDTGGAQLNDASYETGHDQGLDSSNTDDQVLDGDLTADDGGSGFDDSGSYDDGGGGSDDGGSFA
jgi:hypothetical protein